MNEAQMNLEGKQDRIKPIFGEETVSFDVLDTTETTAVLEFVFSGEAESFFGGLREAGYEGPPGRLRIVGLRENNDFKIGVPAHIYLEDFEAITWSPTGDPSDGVVLDGMPG